MTFIIINIQQKIETIKKRGNRTRISKTIRELLWKKYFGDSSEGICPICKTTIFRDRRSRNHKSNEYHAGHIISVKNGGENSIENLLPICPQCNQKMKSQNMDIYLQSKGLLLVDIINQLEYYKQNDDENDPIIDINNLFNEDQCNATTKKGVRCRNVVKKGYDKCWIHLPIAINERCKGITLNGERCSRRKESNSEYCYQHKPKPICFGITKQGLPCKRAPRKGTNYCPSHEKKN